MISGATNIQCSAAVSTDDFPPNDFPRNRAIYLLINDLYVFSAVPTDEIGRGYIGMSEYQRTWAQIGARGVGEVVIDAKLYKPQTSLASAEVEVAFASTALKNQPIETYEQEDLEEAVRKVKYVYLLQEITLTSPRLSKSKYLRLHS